MTFIWVMLRRNDRVKITSLESRSTSSKVCSITDAIWLNDNITQKSLSSKRDMDPEASYNS